MIAQLVNGRARVEADLPHPSDHCTLQFSVETGFY